MKQPSYFNIEWFVLNSYRANFYINFGNIVAQLLDNNITKYYLKVNNEYNTHVFKSKELGDREIKIDKKGNVINVDPNFCIKDPYIYAVASKLKMFKFKPKYRTNYTILKNKDLLIRKRFHIDNGKNVVEFRDKYYNKLRVSSSDYEVLKKFDKIYEIAMRYRNLVQFRSNYKLLATVLKRKFNHSVEELKMVNQVVAALKRNSKSYVYNIYNTMEKNHVRNSN